MKKKYGYAYTAIDVYNFLYNPKNGLIYSLYLKSNLKGNKSFTREERIKFERLKDQNYLGPEDLSVFSEYQRLKMYEKIKSCYKKSVKNSSRFQINPVPLLEVLRKEGFEMLEYLNHTNDVSPNSKNFSLLLRKDNNFLIYRDNFAKKGGPLCLYFGRWNAEMISSRSEKKKSMWLIHSIPHRKPKNSSRLKQDLKLVTRTTLKAMDIR